MKVLIYLLGFGFIALCSYLILFTRETIDSLKDLFGSYPLKYLAAIPAVVGVLFLVAAPAASCPYALRFIGLLCLCEAVFALVNPQDLYSRMLDWYFNRVSQRMHQLFGIVGVVFGTVILTLAW